MSDSYDVVNRNSEALIKLVMTINGGAAVAMLGFSGNLLEGSSPIIPASAIGFSLKTYIVGVVSAVCAFGFMNLYLQANGDPKWSQTWFGKLQEPLRVFAYVSGVVGIASFVCGSWAAADALGSLRPG